MASGGAVFGGTVMGTGAALTVSTPGFQPKYVKLWNADSVQLEWFEGMPAAYGLKQANHDTAQSSIVTSNGITVTASGFTIGTDSVNTDDKLIYFVVMA